MNCVLRVALLPSLFALAPACAPPEHVSAGQRLDDGEGPDLLVAADLPHGEGVRWTYLITSRDEASDSAFAGTIDLDNGVTAWRQVDDTNVTYVEYSDEALRFWGAATDPVLEKALLLLDLPLRSGRSWLTGTADEPELYQYNVVGSEVVETPAGTFDAVRVDQLNRDVGSEVARWYAPGVGLVYRYGPDFEAGVDDARTTLLRYALPAEGGS